MIHIQRSTEPEYFQSEKVRQAKEYLLAQFRDPVRQERLRFDSNLLSPIRDELQALFQYKCAFCESGFELEGRMNIDAFRPKNGSRDFKDQYFPDHYWWLAYEWENLFAACASCNHNKRHWFPIEGVRAPIGALNDQLAQEKPLLINPCLDEPEAHISFNMDGQAIGLTKRGQVTIEIVGLNRPSLIEQRKLVIKDLESRLGILLFSQKVKGLIEKDVVDYISDLFSYSPRQEHVGIQRMVFREWLAKHERIWNLVRNAYTQLQTIETFTQTRSADAQPVSIKVTQQVEKQLLTLKRFSIKRIEIRNFRSISDLTLDVMPPYEQDYRESWLLLLGDNGVGKSSILQAIALTLAGRKQLDKLAIRSADILRRGKRKGFVKVYSHEHNEPIELHFDRKSITGGAAEPPTFLLGYGSTRLLPKGGLKPDSNAERYTKVGNLFDYSVALNAVDEWLSRLKSEQFNKRVAPALFDLLALKTGDKLEVKHGKLLIKQFDDDFVIDEVSDGFKSIIALASDIMQALSADKSSYHSTQGIVLIDELGNHLHPRWRMQIVDSLRRAFPNLQFIVTTHEPLCLRGLAHGEVNVLVRDQQQEIRVLDSKVLPDHNALRVDQLLTSDLFGLLDTIDPKIEKTYEEYYTLLSKNDRTIAEEDKVNELKLQLADKDILGTTPQEQVLYQAIDETFAKGIREDGFKTKEVLKKDAVEKVKTMITQFDWL